MQSLDRFRELTAHKTNGCNEAIEIRVLDEPGSGGACHQYAIVVPDRLSPTGRVHLPIPFQNGPIAEAGTNGITHEALLAILIDRLEGFQGGQYACAENANALADLKTALYWLQSRTKKRVQRGVEGTHRV